MSAPLFSRPVSEETLRREIRALEAEINSAREKRNGIAQAIASRQLKKERLEAQLAALQANTATPSPAMACG